MKKFYHMMFLVCITTTLSLFADDRTMAIDIDAQIAQIQKADPKERRILMNQFKKQLAEMNREERMVAIHRLREKMQAKHGRGVIQPQGHHRPPRHDVVKHLQQQQAIDNWVHSKPPNSTRITQPTKPTLPQHQGHR
ncbi:MAG: hypothetical protein DSY46_07485 [Hydrogenimonas sp.]|nr:MAG: hypothetical protein DSY46_07485 [Hydrogenimonas sp.]